MIVAAAVATSGDDIILTGDETALIERLDDVLADLEPGVLVTWNGAAFDLPFLATRAKGCGVELALRLRLDRRLRTRTPLPGHEGAYRAGWHAHRHLDAYRVWRNDLPRLVTISCSLKSVARFAGYDAIEVDTARVHELEPDALGTYVASDARLARTLAEHRWSTATPFIDESSYVS